MLTPSSSAKQTANGWKLALAQIARGSQMGERAIAASGGSLEFLDRREYNPGDDLRHLDWSAYARSDQLMVRLFQKEITPALEIWIDTSRSMGLDANKAQRTVDLCWVFTQAARAAGCSVRLSLLNPEHRELQPQELEQRGLNFEDSTPLAQLVDAHLGHRRAAKAGCMRFVISDFLSPFDPPKLLRRMSTGAGRLGLVQVLGGPDLDPPSSGTLRLVDVETGAEQSLGLTPAIRSRYLERLHKLQAELRQCTRRQAGLFAIIDSREGLAAQCRSSLAEGGWLLPA